MVKSTIEKGAASAHICQLINFKDFISQKKNSRLFQNMYSSFSLEQKEKKRKVAY
jgi:hypothetical protein